ncbi:MAG: cellobiose phosphorylase [Candidatus Omnitrophica bacterium]|nr:cellobiose phosphorylase [Candidatus Omnitrophota bacterium]
MSKTANKKQVKYYLDPDGGFVIENFNFSRPIANFFPGIAGKYGIPMWVFYVNRGQAIASFGTKDKDHSILEFFPANRAWQLVTSFGFRTFIKTKLNNKQVFYEPFHNGFVNRGFDIINKMSMTSYDLKLEELNRSLGLETRVEYFTIPNDSFASLVRIVNVKNMSRQTKNIQLLDGLPQIVPFGTANLFLKKLSRTIEAWMNVENLDKGVAFYKLSVDPTDRPEVIHIKEGNFYLGFHYENEKASIIKPIVDPASVFGQVTDFSQPYQFLASDIFKPPKKEFTTSKTACAFLPLNLTLKPGQEKSFYALCGYMRSLQTLNSSVKHITSYGYLDKKRQENKKVINELEDTVSTESSSRVFNLYCRQTYLDNVLRGGHPITFKSGQVFHLYSRKHGDLERDYNKFLIQPAYFSQGNGNYRDINQNNRSDIWFNPEVKEDNVITFLNLLQTDGFNPLVVKGASFKLKDANGFKGALKTCASDDDIAKITAHLGKAFTPGEIILFLEDNKIKLSISYDEFLDILISYSVKILEAEHGEGFWIDHWTYNLDLLESYFAISPENLNELLFKRRVVTYFDNTEVVKPRSEKYVLYNGLPRQLHSVTSDTAKKELIRKRHEHPHLVRVDHGIGQVYSTTLINKLLCLFVNKIASLDPFGCGIEMEADKPNWYDALNGLPALFGSSLCETFELKRLINFLDRSLRDWGCEKIEITEEIHGLLLALGQLLKENLDSSKQDKDFVYWDKSVSLKEEYRHKTKLGLSGKEIEMPVSELLEILSSGLIKVEQGIARSRDGKKDIYYSYFINEVMEYEIIHEHFVLPKKFVQKKLPFFLESQMHALRLADGPDQAKGLYEETRKSQLFDKNLRMYKVTAGLSGMPEEIGRCRAFTPGWLENESVWLHMEYKYLLEILKNGLYEEFYKDFKNVLIPFQKPAKYGRSILENSSFIVSSAFPDKTLHGAGFVARLSGSTAEFLQIWLVMNIGARPFRTNKKNELILVFSPALAGWLFEKKQNSYSFNFLGTIRVTYINPRRKDTFGTAGATIKKIEFKDKDGNPVEIPSNSIPAPYALQIRSRQINQIKIYLE